MKGICFKEPLFKSVVAGIKTQTRRIVVTPKNAYEGLQRITKNGNFISMRALDENGRAIKPGTEQEWTINPKYKVGERIYLKEPYRFAPDVDFIIYKYEHPTGMAVYPGCDKDDNSIKWKNKLFMPESAARHFIEITKVRAEMLQDISEEDCLLEGVRKFTKDNTVFKFGIDGWEWQGMPRNPKDAYAKLIDEINGEGIFESNPFVWVYDFKLVK